MIFPVIATAGTYELHGATWVPQHENHTVSILLPDRAVWAEMYGSDLDWIVVWFVVACIALPAEIASGALSGKQVTASGMNQEQNQADGSLTQEQK